MATAGSKRRKRNLAMIAAASEQYQSDEYRAQANPTISTVRAKPISTIDLSKPMTQTDEHGNSWTITFSVAKQINLTAKRLRLLTNNGTIPYPTVVIEPLEQPIPLENGLIETHQTTCYNASVDFSATPGWICVAWSAPTYEATSDKYIVVRNRSDWRSDDNRTE